MEPSASEAVLVSHGLCSGIVFRPDQLQHGVLHTAASLLVMVHAHDLHQARRGTDCMHGGAGLRLCLCPGSSQDEAA